MPGDLRDFIDRCVLADRIERMAQACVEHPGLIPTPQFDQFVADLEGISDELARSFVGMVYDGLTAKREAPDA